MNKTTKKQFEIFKHEVRRWINVFGLDATWSVHIYHEKLKEGIIGECSWMYTGKVARISLNTELPKDISQEEACVEKTAFHEVCELLLAEMQSLINERFGVSVEDKIRASHCVIRTLEKVIYEQAKN